MRLFDIELLGVSTFDDKTVIRSLSKALDVSYGVMVSCLHDIPALVKTRVPERTAQVLVSELLQIGADIRVTELQSRTSKTFLAGETPTSGDYPVGVAADREQADPPSNELARHQTGLELGQTACPNCDTLQSGGEICENCGAVFSEFTGRRNRLRDLLDDALEESANDPDWEGPVALPETVEDLESQVPVDPSLLAEDETAGAKSPAKSVVHRRVAWLTAGLVCLAALGPSLFANADADHLEHQTRKGTVSVTLPQGHGDVQTQAAPAVSGLGQIQYVAHAVSDFGDPDTLLLFTYARMITETWDPSEGDLVAQMATLAVEQLGSNITRQERVEIEGWNGVLVSFEGSRNGENFYGRGRVLELGGEMILLMGRSGTRDYAEGEELGDFLSSLRFEN